MSQTNSARRSIGAQLEQINAELLAALYLHPSLVDRQAGEMQEAIVIADAQGMLLFLNGVAARLLGGKVHDFVGADISSILPEKVTSKVLPVLEKAIASGERIAAESPVEVDGKTKWFRTSVTPLTDSSEHGQSALVICQDVTDRKTGEQKRKMIERVLLMSPAVTFVWRDQPRFPVEYVSDNSVIFGYAPEEFYEDKVRYLDLVHPEDRSAVTAWFETGLASEDSHSVLREYRLVKPDGEVIWVNAEAAVRQTQDGDYIRFEGIVIDVSERRAAQLAQEVSLAQYLEANADRIQLGTAIEQVDVAIVITDLTGQIQYVNPAFEKITGYRAEEVVGQNPRIVKSGFHDDLFYKQLWETIVAGRVWQGQLHNRRKDGEYFVEEATISPVKDASGATVSFVAAKRDVTNKLRLEAQVRQSQKMEAIGTLAGGIAHDFNNILQGILGFADLAKDGVEEEAVETRYLNEILKAGHRAVEMVDQILTFSRTTEQNKAPLRLQPILKEAIRLMGSSAPADISFAKEISPSCGLVDACPIQTHQMVVNLFTNAFHAMRQSGGVLTVRLEQVKLGVEIAPPLSKLDPGQYAKLTVEDTGHGMAPELIERIFDPYFTTKSVGEGSGMGLAIVHGIVESCAGAVRVRSELDRGSAFEVFLPVTPNLVTATESGANEATALGGTETVLFVDDEEPLVVQARDGLSRFGYKVEGYIDSQKALERFRRSPGDFDVVVTDQGMPGLSGDELVCQLCSIRSDIPIVLFTGYGESSAEASESRSFVTKEIHKPVLMNDLAAAIREVLD